MGRAPCCDKANVKKGPWSPEEDAKLKDYIEKYGTGGNWIALPQKVGLKRCGKSCRLRWLNYLRPNIKHGEFSDEEDRIICTLFANIGSRWSIIAAQLPGRTDNDIKNYWNTKLKKKLMGFVHHHNNSFNTNNNTNNKFLINPTFQNTSSHHDHHHHQQPLLISSSPLFQNSTTSRSLSSYSSNYTMNMLMNSTESADYNNLINFQANNNNQYSVNTTTSTSSGGNNNNLLMFGTNNNEGSCSTSSEGSCNYQIKQEEINGFHRQTQQTSFVNLLSNNNNNFGGFSLGEDDHNSLNLMWGQKLSSGFFGGALLDDHHNQDHDYNSQYFYPSGDVKQVISTSHTNTSSGNVGSNNYFMSFFNVDENKTLENNKVMYF